MIHAYLFVPLLLHTFIQMHVHTHIHTSTHTYTYTYPYIHTYTYISTCTYILHLGLSLYVVNYFPSVIIIWPVILCPFRLLYFIVALSLDSWWLHLFLLDSIDESACHIYFSEGTCGTAKRWLSPRCWSMQRTNYTTPSDYLKIAFIYLKI